MPCPETAGLDKLRKLLGWGDLGVPWSGGAEKFLFSSLRGWKPAWAMQKGRDKKGAQQPDWHGLCGNEELLPRAQAVWRENV